MSAAGAAEAAGADAPPGSFLRDVLDGLAQREKAIPGKHLWDEAGSRIFDAITRSQTYYPTAAEMTILPRTARDLAGMVGPDTCIVEFGSGAGHKVGVLLDALRGTRRYVAIDISGDMLGLAACRTRQAYPGLDVVPLRADYSRELPPLPLPPSGDVLGFFPGTSVGNMPPASAEGLLARIKRALGPSRLLIGLDSTRDASRLAEAYGGPLMAALHENLLRRMADELSAVLAPRDFRHEARLFPEPARVEAHLVARRATAIGIGEARFGLAAGESIRTDVSWKHAPGAFGDLAAAAGWHVERRWTDAREDVSLTLLRTG